MSTLNLCFVILLVGYGLCACLRTDRNRQDQPRPQRVSKLPR